MNQPQLDVEITHKAAYYLGLLFKTIHTRSTFSQSFNDVTILKFILQCMLVMWSEKCGILTEILLINQLNQSQNMLDTNDILMRLDQQLKKLENQVISHWFSVINPFPLTDQEVEILQICAQQNWQQIRPAIFGNIFEGAIASEQRHKHGIHYTSEADIMHIVRPTISQFWENRIEIASSLEELAQLQLELRHYKVLDPACGSGNFLYIAYQELKRIEQILLEKMMTKLTNFSQPISLVTPLQFYGMDINPFAVELARVTLTIARKIAIDNFHLNEPILPLDSLDKNIICADALFTDWIDADAIIGNPPFLGGKKLRSELGDDYVENINQLFPSVKGQPDFCIFWFRKAHDRLAPNGRAGLVGTNSISQVSTRAASLDYIVNNGGFIHEAIATQPWSGEAKVYVSIVNWSKEKPAQLFLDHQPVSLISTSLKAEISVSNANRLRANKNFSFQSCELSGKGFIISAEEAQLWISQDEKNQEVLKPMIDGKSLIYPDQKLDWVIDFNDRSIEAASQYQLPFQHLQATVKPERDKNREELRKNHWWKHGRPRPAMREAIKNLSCYFAMPKIAKYILFSPVNISILPCEANMIIASDDFYILGILNCSIHRDWALAQSSSLGQTTRYTNTTCFETFPFPQQPTQKMIIKIRELMEQLHEYRTVQMQSKKWGITQLYNEFFNEPASQLFQLHQQLDRAVMSAYNFSKTDNLLGQIWALNQALAAREKDGEKVIGPWPPDQEN